MELREFSCPFSPTRQNPAHGTVISDTLWSSIPMHWRTGDAGSSPQRHGTGGSDAMRENRNAILVLAVFIFFAWTFWAWFMFFPDPPNPTGQSIQRIASTTLLALSALLLVKCMFFQDKLSDSLATYAGGIYYEVNGLCFIPVMRKSGEQAYIHLYFENRFEGECCVIVHMKPPEDSIQHRPDARDIHFSFSVPGGGVGVVKQPVAVHPRLQGAVVDVQVAAAVNYPHSHGDQLRSHTGLPCGTFDVDWGETFRIGARELLGDIQLENPITIHLPIPRDVTNVVRKGRQWELEIFSRYDT